MAKMNMIAALNSALKHQLQSNPNVVIFGEDVGYFGGVFRVTAGLQEEFGHTESLIHLLQKVVLPPSQWEWV